MLVLSRKQGERVLIGHEIEVVVLEIRGNRIKLGFEGPAEVPIHREEIHEQVAAEQPGGYHAECA